MSMKVFKEIVDAAKQQQLEIQGLETLVSTLEKKLEGTTAKYEMLAKANRNPHKVIDGGITIDMNKFGPRPRVHEDVKHDDLTMGIVGLTSKPDLNGKIMAKINFTHPLTGRNTSKSKVVDTLVAAIIARNEIAAILLQDGFIDLETFKKYTAL